MSLRKRRPRRGIADDSDEIGEQQLDGTRGKIGGARQGVCGCVDGIDHLTGRAVQHPPCTRQTPRLARFARRPAQWTITKLGSVEVDFGADAVVVEQHGPRRPHLCRARLRRQRGCDCLEQRCQAGLCDPRVLMGARRRRQQRRRQRRRRRRRRQYPGLPSCDDAFVAPALDDAHKTRIGGREILRAVIEAAAVVGAARRTAAAETTALVKDRDDVPGIKQRPCTGGTSDPGADHDHRQRRAHELSQVPATVTRARSRDVASSTASTSRDAMTSVASVGRSVRRSFIWKMPWRRWRSLGHVVEVDEATSASERCPQTLCRSSVSRSRRRGATSGTLY